MTQAAQILKANKINGIFILQPLLLGKTIKSEKEQKQVEHFRTQDYLFWENTYPLLAKSLEILTAKEDFIWINFQHTFDNVSKNIFGDTFHLNDQGQELLARALFKTIQKNLLIKTEN